MVGWWFTHSCKCVGIVCKCIEQQTHTPSNTLTATVCYPMVLLQLRVVDSQQKVKYDSTHCRLKRQACTAVQGRFACLTTSSNIDVA
jgi:hypothetical protein